MTVAAGNASPHGRRHRNPIHLIPVSAAHHVAYRYVTVVSAHHDGVPLHRANLARGPHQLIVLPDESGAEPDAEDWRRLGTTVERVRLHLPARAFTYHYLLIATIALAEVARQAGRRATDRRPSRGQAPFYDRAVAILATDEGETVSLDDLQCY